MNIGDVFLTVRANLSQFQASLAGLNSDVSRTATNMGKTLSKVGAGLSGTGMAMTRNLTVPILAAGAATGKMALDFDTAMRQIVGLTDVTADQVDGLREQIFKLGAEIGQGPQELAEAFYFVASAGFEAEEAMEVLEIAAKGAASGMGQTQDVAKVLAGVINAYGHENLSAAVAADQLTAAVQKGSAEASDFAGVIGRVAPGAAALGVSFDQVTAALAGMTNVGISADEAATSLVQIFSSLLKPTTQADEAMKGLGLSAAGLRQQLREEGLLSTLRTLEERFAGNETASAAVFGNIRALRGITALLQIDTAQLNSIFDATANSLGSLSGAYEDTEGPQRELDRAMAEIQATAIVLGTDVLPIVVDVLKSLAGGAKELAAWWRSLDDGTKKMVVQMLAMVAITGPLLLVVGKLVSGLGALFKVVGFLSGAKGIPLLLKHMGKLGLIGIAIAAYAAISTLSDAVHHFFDELFQGKKATLQLRELEDAVGDFKKAWLLRELGVDAKEFARAVEIAGGDVTAAFDAISHAQGDLAVAIGDLRREFGELADDTSFEQMDRRAQRALRGVIETAEEIPQELAATLVDGQYVVGPAAEEMVDPVQEAMQKAIEDAGAAARALNEAFLTGLTSDRDTFKKELEAFLEDVLSPYKDTLRVTDIAGALASKGFSRALHSNDSRDVALTADYINELLAQYQTLEPGALEAGEAINPALQAGIDSNLDAAIEWLRVNVADGVTDTLTLADILEERGYGGIAAYIRGQERARKEKLYNELNATRAAINDTLAIDKYGSGYQIGASLADGINDSAYLATRAALRLAGEIRALLRIASEPTDPRSPLRGITKWGGNLVSTLAHSMLGGLDELARAAAAVGEVMVPQVGALSPAFAGVTVPSIDTGLYGAPTAAPAGGTVNNTWVLSINGVDYEFQSKDDFIKALDDVSGFGDGRL